VGFGREEVARMQEEEEEEEKEERRKQGKRLNTGIVFQPKEAIKIKLPPRNTP
jgi:hypothetical protein